MASHRALKHPDRQRSSRAFAKRRPSDNSGSLPVPPAAGHARPRRSGGPPPHDPAPPAPRDAALPPPAQAMKPSRITGIPLCARPRHRTRHGSNLAPAQAAQHLKRVGQHRLVPRQPLGHHLRLALQPVIVDAGAPATQSSAAPPNSAAAIAAADVVLQSPFHPPPSGQPSGPPHPIRCAAPPPPRPRSSRRFGEVRRGPIQSSA